ncbi:hypothetical protein B0T10DRAFT_365127, partial [Thelonectria olida]
SVFITGCGPGGIGASLAKEFYHRVFASGRTPEETDPSLSDLRIDTLVVDVTSSKSIEAAAQMIRAKTGGTLDVLINNAGLIHVMPFADTPVAEVRRLFDVTVFAIWVVTQAFLPLL